MTSLLQQKPPPLPPKLIIASRDNLVDSNPNDTKKDVSDLISKGVPFYTPEKISDILKILSECLLNASIVCKSISDQGRIMKYIRDIQEAITLRKDDLEFYLSKRSASSFTPTSALTAVAVSPNTMDPSPLSLSRYLYEVQRSGSELNDRLKKYRAKPSRFLLSSIRKEKLLGLSVSLQEAWMSLLIQLSLSVSRASSDAASATVGNMNRLAVAAGAEDWQELSSQDAQSFYLQGEKYFMGYGVPRSYEIAFKRYHAAAKLGLADAANMLGVMYENGYGKQKDLPNAVIWYKAAALSSNADALNHLGRINELGKGCPVNYDAAFEFYRKASDLGHADGMCNYVNLLQLGKGCSQNLPLAYETLILAAELEYPRAQNALGHCYYLGKGVESNYSLAVTHFKKASDQGFVPGHNNLGICYEEGNGVPKDHIMAKFYYTLAAENFHPNGTNNLGYMYLLEGNLDESIKQFNIALSLGSIDAAYNLGTIYESGYTKSKVSVSKDIPSAIRYYTQAADHGCVKSQLKLAHIYLYSLPPNQDFEKALEYLLKAAEEDPSHLYPTSIDSECPNPSKGNSDAKNLIGELLELGYGDNEQNANPAAAAHWYKKAMKQGNARATFNLAALYESGEGVSLDLNRAVRLYNEADKRGSKEAHDRLQELSELGII